MDAVIDYDEAAGFLKNPISLEPRPNFTNIRALQKHIVHPLVQLSCPQSAIHGWSGLAMDPASYLLLEGAAFTIPLDPGPTAIFPGGVADEVAAVINRLAANQLAIMSQMAATNAQMAALSVIPPQAQHTQAFAPRK